MSRRRGPGEGSIYKRTDGRWAAQVDLGWESGERRRKTVYGRTRSEVADKLHALQQQLRDGLMVSDDRTPLATFLPTWLDTVVAPSVRPRTYESYASVVNNHLLPALGNKTVGKLRAQHIQQLLADKAAAGLSDRTVEYIWLILRRALTVAVRWGLVVRNVADVVTPPRPTQREITPLSITEVGKVLDTARDDRLGAAVTLALTTGMRRGEILGLQWGDIDLTTTPTRLRVRRNLQRIGGRLQTGEPKSAKGRRTITLSNLAMAALASHRARQAKERLAAGELWQDHQYVFTTTTGSPVDPRNFLRSWHHILERAGLQRRPLHEARHSAASLLLSEGVPLKIVQETLGHSTIALTADLYGHLMPDDTDKVADAMDRALGA